MVKSGVTNKQPYILLLIMRDFFALSENFNFSSSTLITRKTNTKKAKIILVKAAKKNNITDNFGL
jgi:hypothetical protein